MSWSSAPTTSRSGRLDAVGERGGVGRGLEQVTVDGEPVVGVALRAAAHGRPLRQQRRPAAPLVECLDHGDGRRPHRQQSRRTVPGVRRPRRRASRRLGASGRGSRTDRRPPGVRRRDPRVSDELRGSGVADVGLRRTRASRSTTHSVPSVPVHRRLRPNDRASSACSPDSSRPGDGPRRGGDLGHQRIGIEIATQPRRRRPVPGGADGRPVRPVARCSSTRTVEQQVVACPASVGLVRVARRRSRARRERPAAARGRHAGRRGPPSGRARARTRPHRTRRGVPSTDARQPSRATEPRRCHCASASSADRRARSRRALRRPMAGREQRGRGVEVVGARRDRLRTVRTECPSFRPASQIGYQRRSATSATPRCRVGARAGG